MLKKILAMTTLIFLMHSQSNATSYNDTIPPQTSGVWINNPNNLNFDSQYYIESDTADAIRFDSEYYRRSWTNKISSYSRNKLVATTEFLRQGETYDSWTRMLTFIRYDNAKKAADVVNPYMDLVRPMLVTKPVVYSQPNTGFKEDILIKMSLLSPDNTYSEFILHRIVSNKVKPVRSIIFSLRMPVGQNVDYDRLLSNKGIWMEELGEMNLFEIEKLTINKNENR